MVMAGAEVRQGTSRAHRQDSDSEWAGSHCRVQGIEQGLVWVLTDHWLLCGKRMDPRRQGGSRRPGRRLMKVGNASGGSGYGEMGQITGIYGKQNQ